MNFRLLNNQLLTKIYGGQKPLVNVPPHLRTVALENLGGLFYRVIAM